MTAGRTMNASPSDTRRAIFGVMGWIALLLVGYWLVTDGQSLPAPASSLLTSVR